jgi:hypothetical protein
MNREEADLQRRFIAFLRAREWFVKATHGNLYQQGFPDLFATHSVYKQRWIEMKIKKNLKFTPAQLDTFPKMCAHGAGVWVITDCTQQEYDKLFKRPNWQDYALYKSLGGTWK